MYTTSALANECTHKRKHTKMAIAGELGWKFGNGSVERRHIDPYKLDSINNTNLRKSTK